MRVFALSDVHVDYDENDRWIADLSIDDYRADVLILAGDLTDVRSRFERCLTNLARRFRQVLFVPGNHDLWVVRDARRKHSLEKFEELHGIVGSCGVSMQPFAEDGVRIIPLFGWYDYSFGLPGEELRSLWMDYRACRWPENFREEQIAEYFERLNEDRLHGSDEMVITFSHFLPRVDVMPDGIPHAQRFLYPILGTTRLDRQLRQVGSTMHVYGHSHVNRRKQIDGVTYINNAFGYPSESRIASKQLTCIHER